MNIKSPVIPPLYTTLMNLKRETMVEFNCIKPGKIESYDPSTRTAEVSVGLAQVLADGTIRPYPKLVDCPVVTIQGGGVGVAFPIKAGDPCLILFSDRCIDDWYNNGGANPPPDGRLHDLSDGFVLVGANPQTSMLMLALLPSEGGIADATAKVAILNGKVAIKNGTKSLEVILSTLLTTLTSLNNTLAAMTTASILAGTTQATIAGFTSTFTSLSADIAALLYP